MGWGRGADPGGAAIVGEKAILFLDGVFCEIAAYDDQVLAAMVLVMVFYGDGIGPCRGSALKQGEIDRFIADEQPGAGAAAYEAGFIAVQGADIGAAAGETAFAGLGLWPLQQGILPGVAAGEAAGYEEAAIDRVADDDAALAIPKFHCVEEHPSRFVLVYQFPGLSAVRSLQDVGGFGDRHDHGGLCIKSFDIAEITFFVTRNDDPGPGGAAVEGLTYRAAAAADPNDLIADHAEAAQGGFCAAGEELDCWRSGSRCGGGWGGLLCRSRWGGPRLLGKNGQAKCSEKATQ